MHWVKAWLRQAAILTPLRFRRFVPCTAGLVTILLLGLVAVFSAQYVVMALDQWVFVKRRVG